MDSTNQDSLEFSPSKYLEFAVTPNSSSEAYINVKNTSGSDVAYKVKTTTPSKFLVHPCIGILNPHQKVNIKVRLHPINERELLYYQTTTSAHSNDQSVILGTQDKFQILSQNLYDHDPTRRPHDVWSQHKVTDKGHRLSVVLSVSAATMNQIKNQINYSPEFLNNPLAETTQTFPTSETIPAPQDTISGQLGSPPQITQLEQMDNITIDEFKKKYKEIIKYAVSLENRLETMQLEKHDLELQLQNSSKTNISYSLQSILSKLIPLLIAIPILLFVITSLRGFIKQ